MAPILGVVQDSASVGTGGHSGSWRLHASDEDFILESWSEGFLVGSLIIMGCITVANMRRGVLLHKLILAEQLLAMSHGTFCFMGFNGYGWYLSSTAALLYSSWLIHNIVAWMKIRPFFCEPRSMFSPKTGMWVRRIYLITLACTIPPIILQIYDNFRYFNNLGELYKSVRPYEPLMRDPWWVFTCITLFHVIRKCYGTGVVELIKRSPRFGILLCAICLAMIMTIMDITASIKNFIGSTDGINPWWKLSLVFKCLTDTIMLDDFKTELKRLGVRRIRKEEMRRQSTVLVADENNLKFSEHDQLEFTDMLRQRPSNSATKRSSLEKGEANQRLRENSVHEKEPIGKGGRKISQLPGLGRIRFEGIKPGKKGVGHDEESHPKHEEKEDDEALRPGPVPATAKFNPEDRLTQMRQSLGIVDYRPD